MVQRIFFFSLIEELNLVEDILLNKINTAWEDEHSVSERRSLRYQTERIHVRVRQICSFEKTNRFSVRLSIRWLVRIRILLCRNVSSFRIRSACIIDDIQAVHGTSHSSSVKLNSLKHLRLSHEKEKKREIQSLESIVRLFTLCHCHGKLELVRRNSKSWK